jgi:asparagine synthase (glutamine-hydrolysing)
MAARGPDGCDQIVRGWVGVAHQHFWTTPEELGERQPLSASRDRVLLGFDGRLDNRQELLAELDIDGGNPSDAALVVAAYERWGEEFCQHLIGPFAIVIANLERRQVLCARDPLGDRTLFYHLTDRKLVVASEESALLAHPEIGADLDETRLACFFALRVPADGSTFFRQVRELLPGELLCVDQKSVRQSEFWRPRAEPSLHRRSEVDLAEEYRELLRQAVQSRLRAAAPPAVMLSGGLDSTSVAALGAESLLDSHPDWRLRAVSWVFDEFRSCDERSFMDPVVDRWRLDALRVNGDEAIPLSHEGVLGQIPGTPEDNPYRDLKGRVFSLAAQVGSRVVLNCATADALYAGSESWFEDLVRAGHLASAIKDLSIEARRRGPWNALRRTTLLRWPAKVKRSILPQRAREMAWLRPEARRRAAAATSPRFEAQSGLRANQVEAATGLRAARSFSLENVYAARAGIELRDPYRDLRLVEFMLRLPAHQLYRHGRFKHIARRALTGWLPDSIVQRTDPTLMTPIFHAGLRGRNRRVVEDLLESKDAIWPRYVERRWILEALEESISPALDVVLWQCVSCELWRRRWGWSSTALTGDLS